MKPCEVGRSQREGSRQGPAPGLRHRWCVSFHSALLVCRPVEAPLWEPGQGAQMGEGLCMVGQCGAHGFLRCQAAESSRNVV